VRNFRGCAKAEIVCDPIALVAGRNAAGKSSLAMAVGAALVGTTLPLNIVNKKDAPALVMTGASEGLAEITAEGGGIARITWPACEMTTQGDPPRASFYAAGLASVATMPPKERAQELADYLHADPAREDLTAALNNAGLGDEAYLCRVDQRDG
jgi:hypothetical protein